MDVLHELGWGVFLLAGAGGTLGAFIGVMVAKRVYRAIMKHGASITPEEGRRRVREVTKKVESHRLDVEVGMYMRKYNGNGEDEEEHGNNKG